MSTDYKFEGWVGLDANAAKGNMVWQSYEPKAFQETDIDIEITHSGICGSDIHTLSRFVPVNPTNLTNKIQSLISYFFKRLGTH